MTQPARRRFPGRHDQVSSARAFVKGVLGDCPQLDDAVLLTSGLCTNALRHTHSGDGGTFEVTVYHRPGSLRIEVRDDGSAGAPVPQSFGSCSEDGRGLEIVACLAHRWGQRGDEYGRCVYFELRWTDPAGSERTATGVRDTARPGSGAQRSVHPEADDVLLLSIDGIAACVGGQGACRQRYPAAAVAGRAGVELRTSIIVRSLRTCSPGRSSTCRLSTRELLNSHA